MKTLITTFLIIVLMQNTFAQINPALQDSTLNNLVLPAGYKTCTLGELGALKKAGSAKQSMILIPGLGFGGEVFESFINHYKKEFTIYTITPAGFAGTPSPTMPDITTPYSQFTWTNGIVTGILNLIEKEKLSKPTIVAHFVTGTQVALNLALNYPDKIGQVIIMGGSPYWYYAGMKDGQLNDWVHESKYTPEQREKITEVYWAPKWFKTVTRKTWDANMWTPESYCKDSTAGKKLFAASADVPVQVMIRYLLEYIVYDVNEKFKDIKVPTLILIPDFKGIQLTPDTSNKVSCAKVQEYLKYFHQEGWQKAKDSGNPLLQFQTVADTRLFMWYDNPKAVYGAIDQFRDSKNKRSGTN